MAAALASGRRVEIIEVLAQGERTVEETAREIGQSIANTSHHLRALARAGLVVTRRQGTHVHYRPASEEVVKLWGSLRCLAADRVEAIEELARAYLGDRQGLAVMSREELRDRLQLGDVVLIDVRPEAEYAAGHIPGAESIPPDELDRLDGLLADLPGDGDIVAYCRGPYCVYADDAIRYLAGRGRGAVRLEDGLPEWRQWGGPIAS